MGIEGVGARVVRKEDKRFITGKGRYVDDIRLHGVTYAAFVRSPHAHAKVKGVDTAAAKAMISVGRRPTRSEKRPHMGALKSCATVKAATMIPEIVPMPRCTPRTSMPDPPSVFT